MSSSSSTAVGAKNGDQSLMQHPSGSSEEARGDPCKATVSQDDYQEDQTMPLVSAVHPMHERPQVVDGPYAPVKYKKGQKGLDDFAPDDSELARKAEYEDLKRRLEAAYRLRVDEVTRKGQEVTHDANARMNQAYHLLQRRFEVDKLKVANESAAMKQCIQELESHATLKHAVVEYQASTYVEKQKLEAQAREAEQYQELRMFEHHTKMEVILQAQGRDAEVRAQYEAELLERQRRNDAEAKRFLEVERNKIAMASHLELQDMQAKMMHCEAMTSRAHHEVEDQRHAAAEEVHIITNAATTDRQRSSFQLDNEANAFQKSMTEAWERQKVTLYDEFRSQKEREQQALQ
jgi:hypothetical protein